MLQTIIRTFKRFNNDDCAKMVVNFQNNETKYLVIGLLNDLEYAFWHLCYTIASFLTAPSAYIPL